MFVVRFTPWSNALLAGSPLGCVPSGTVHRRTIPRALSCSVPAILHTSPPLNRAGPTTAGGAARAWREWITIVSSPRTASGPGTTSSCSFSWSTPRPARHTRASCTAGCPGDCRPCSLRRFSVGSAASSRNSCTASVSTPASWTACRLLDRSIARQRGWKWGCRICPRHAFPR